MKLLATSFSYLKRLPHKILTFFHDYNGAITAFSTLILSVVTWMYLNEVQDQRIFNYKQLAIQNSPVVEIQTLTPFSFDNVLSTSAKILNSGGVLENLRIGIVLLCCSAIEQATNNPDVIKDLVWGTYRHRLGRGQIQTRFMEIREDQRAWLETALNDKNSVLVYAYIRADYSSPANAIQSVTEYSDSASLWWNPRFKQWMEMNQKGHELVKKVIVSKGSLAVGCLKAPFREHF